MPLERLFPFRGPLSSIILALLVFGLGVGVDHLAARHGGGLVRLTDDVAAGVIAGLLLFAYDRRRRRLLMERLEIIMLMNHHVRNALQTIVYAQYGNDRERQVAVVQEAVQRIDWALKEILPGLGVEDERDTNVAANRNGPR